MLAISAALLLGLAGCGDGTESPAPSAEEVLEEATYGGIRSANVDLAMQIGLHGGERTSLVITLFGPVATGRNGTTRTDLVARVGGEVEGEKVDVEVGLVRVGRRGYLEYEGVAYEMGAGAGTDTIVPCLREFGELSLAGLIVDGASSRRDSGIGGEPTVAIRGRVEARTAVGLALEALEERPCSPLLTALADVVTVAEIEAVAQEARQGYGLAYVEVGEDDIVRQLIVEPDVTPAAGPDLDRAGVNIDLKLTGLNEPQEFEVPQDPRPRSQLRAAIGAKWLRLLERLGVV